MIAVADLKIDLTNYRLTRDDEMVRLTPTEWSLLRELIVHNRQVLEHRTLLRRVWGDEYGKEVNYVHTYISRLRRKLEADANNPQIILTEPGIGYWVDLPDDTTTAGEGHPQRTQGHGQPKRPRLINPLPQDVNTRFVGREREQAALLSLIQENARLVSVYGRAGVGKTALVSKVLADALDRVEELAVIALSANSTGISVARIFADFERLLSDPLDLAEKSPTAQRVTALIEQIGGESVLLLLDNLETVQHEATGKLLDDELTTFLRVAVEQSSALRILVTSRFPLPLPRSAKTRERLVPLEDGLAVEDGIVLLRACDPDGEAGLRDAPEEKLRLLAERTRGFPRALEAAAGLLLEDALLSIDDLLADDLLFTSEVDSVLVGGAVQRLSAEAQQVMEVLAVFGTPVPLQAVEAVLPEMSTVRATLNRLVKSFFVSYNPLSQMFGLHPIDRDYCYGQSSPENRSALHRAAASYFAEQRSDNLYSIADLEPQLNEFHHLVQSGLYTEAATLLVDLDQNYLSVWGHMPQLAERYERVVDHLEAGALLQQVRLRLGEAYRGVGRIQQAVDQYNAVLVVTGDDAQALNNLGWANYDLGHFTTALDYWGQALTVFQDLENEHGAATVLGGMGWVSYLLGEYEQAEHYFEDALRMQSMLRDLAGMGVNLGDLGVVRTAQGRYEAGIANLHESLSIASSLNSAREKSYKGAYLATALLLAGDIAGAQEAAFTAQRAQFTVNQPVVGAIHGVTLVRLGELDEAARTFSYAIKQASELIEHTHGLYTLWYARALAHAGQVLTGESTIDDAMRDYRHAQALCAERGVLRANARLLEALREADGDGLIASLPPLPAE